MRLLALLLPHPASAQVEACAGPFSLAEWDEALDAVDQALVELDGARASSYLDHVVGEARCLDELVAPERLGRLARQVSLVAFYAQDPDELAYWALLARETAGGAPWPEGVPVPDRFHELVADLGEPRAGELDGVGFAPPKGGAVLVDGRFAAEPAATLGVQHLVQVADKKGRAVSTSWQTGTAFDELWLLSGAAAVDVPRWYEEPPPPPPLEVPDEPDVAEPEPEPRVRFDGDGRTADCPWRTEPRKAAVKGRKISINRFSYTVRTDEERAAFKSVLRSCGELRAARRFKRWQQARKKLFSSGRKYREAMLEALLSEEPERKKRSE